MSFAKIIPMRYLWRWKGGVMAHGCFDLLHIGHIRYLHWAKSLAPSLPLVVTTTADDYFPTYKGEGRPAFPQDIRAEWIAAIGVVDVVSVIDDKTAVPAIEVMRPSIYAKGHAAEGMIPHEQEATERHGGVVQFMPADSPSYSQHYSSGRILSGQYLRSRIVEQKMEKGDYLYE